MYCDCYFSVKGLKISFQGQCYFLCTQVTLQVYNVIDLRYTFSSWYFFKWTINEITIIIVVFVCCSKLTDCVKMTVPLHISNTGGRGAQPLWVLPQATVIRVGAAILDQLQIY